MIESCNSLVDPQNLICQVYHGGITSKIFCLKNYLLYIAKNLHSPKKTAETSNNKILMALQKFMWFLEGPGLAIH